MHCINQLAFVCPGKGVVGNANSLLIEMENLIVNPATDYYNSVLKRLLGQQVSRHLF